MSKTFERGRGRMMMMVVMTTLTAHNLLDTPI